MFLVVIVVIYTLSVSHLLTRQAMFCLRINRWGPGIDSRSRVLYQLRAVFIRRILRKTLAWQDMGHFQCSLRSITCPIMPHNWSISLCANRITLISQQLETLIDPHACN